MRFFQHRFDKVDDYLHHRDPYLLVERIVSLSPTEIETEKTISGQEFFLPGHFPGAPVFPGAMLQELTTQSAGILIAAYWNPMQDYNTADPAFHSYALGVLVRVHQARYRDFARPGDRLLVKAVLNERVDTLFDFSATVSVGTSLIMRNGFQLTNIPSQALAQREVDNALKDCSSRPLTQLR